MFRKLRMVALALLTLAGAVAMGVGHEVVAPEQAGAQGSYLGPVLPCPGTSNGWYSVYNGAANCAYQVTYQSGTVTPLWHHYTIDVHSPNSNGSACTWNVNCAMGAIECWTDSTQVRYTATVVGSALRFGSNFGVGFNHNRGWYRNDASGFNTYLTGPNTNPYNNSNTPQISGMQNLRVGLEDEYLTAPGAGGPWSLYHNDPYDHSACFSNYRGVVAGRTFGTGSLYASYITNQAYNTPANAAEVYVWTHCYPVC